MTPIETLLAVLLLLGTPGPTNTLIAAAGAERGWRGALRVVPAELAGYLATVVPLALAGSRFLEAAPMLKSGLTLAAALWVAWLALSMWRIPGGARAAVTVTARLVFVTTLLNPKALVFGLLILPAAGWARALGNLVLFAAEVAVVACAWAALGAALRGGGPARAVGLPPTWRRATALLLAALSAWLAGRVAGLA